MRREHIRITVVYDRLSSRTRLRCDVVTSLLAIVTFRTYGFVNSYVLLSVPMFLMMASILDKSGVAHDLYDALKIWAGRVPGGMGVMTLIAASVMAAMTGIIGGITYLKSIMTGRPFDPIGVVLLMMAIFLLLGMFMDWFSIMLLTMPIFAPTVTALGYDLIWFGVLFNITMQVGYLSPPFGQAAAPVIDDAPDIQPGNPGWGIIAAFQEEDS